MHARKETTFRLWFAREFAPKLCDDYDYDCDDYDHDDDHHHIDYD